MPTTLASPSLRPVRIACIAVATVDGMLAANYARALRLGELALAERPDVVLFPEAFAAGYCGQPLAAFAEPLDGPWQQAMAQLSRAGNCLVVSGFLESAPSLVWNSVALYDHGTPVAVHRKSSLWCDAARAYRDEPSQMLAGPGMEIFPTRFGPLAVLTCYENMLPANWDTVAGRATWVLSPYNCEDDPGRHQVAAAQRLGLPSAWANRTGTVYAGTRWLPNPGTAGLVQADGTVSAKSTPGVEAIIVGDLLVATRF